MLKNVLISSCDVHPSNQTMPQSLTRTNLLTFSGVENLTVMNLPKIAIRVGGSLEGI